jgi:hypothetical protein
MSSVTGLLLFRGVGAWLPAADVLSAVVGRVIGPAHFILYVRDQASATVFWQAVLDRRRLWTCPG